MDYLALDLVQTFRFVPRAARGSLEYLRAEYTGRVNRTGMGSVFWSRSYFAASCGGAPLSIIRQYIEGQRRPLS